VRIGEKKIKRKMKPEKRETRRKKEDRYQMRLRIHFLHDKSREEKKKRKTG